MTFLPHDNRDVVGVDGLDPIELEPVCYHPFCEETEGLQRHHMWRRSFLVGAYDWVRLWDGRVVGNVVHLCLHHHEPITENEARIVWTGEHFAWRDDGLPELGDVPLDPAVPLLSPALSPEPSSDPTASERRTEKRCPTCRKPIRKGQRHKHHPNEDKPFAGRRQRGIAIPAWARTGGEDGANLMDSLLEQAGEILKVMDVNVPPKHRGHDYAVFTAVFVDFVSRNRELLKEGTHGESV